MLDGAREASRDQGRKSGTVASSLSNQGTQTCRLSMSSSFKGIKISPLPIWQEESKQERADRAESGRAEALSADSGPGRGWAWSSALDSVSSSLGLTV